MVTRAQFLKDHPALAATEAGSAERRRFLANNPRIAMGWGRTDDSGETDAQRQARLTGSVGVPRRAAPPAATGPGAAAPGAPQTQASPQAAAQASAQAAAQAAPQVAAAPQPAVSVTGTSAAGILKAAMEKVGLGDLGEWAWQQSISGMPDSQIELGLRERPEYKTRFSGLAALKAKGRTISEGEYIGLEQTYAAQMRARGLPATFYDTPDDFGKLIGAEVSPQEFGERLSLAEEAAMNSPKAAQVRDELTRLYNVPNAQGLLTAFFIDPDRSQTIIKAQYQASTTAAASKRAGFGSLTKTEAERIGGLGVSEAQAAGTFSSLAGMDEFRHNLPGAARDAATREDLLAAGFEDNAQAKAKIERTARRRTATFEGGGNFSSSQRGITGLGTSNG